MTKADIRKMAEELGLSVANRPSAPCLATRFTYGTELSYKKMQKVEKGEEYIKSLGFYNVRIRVHEDIARIEVDSEDIIKLLEHSKAIAAYLKDLGYPYVTARPGRVPLRKHGLQAKAVEQALYTYMV